MPLRAFVMLGIIMATALAIRLYPVIETPEKFRNGFGPFGDSYLYHVIAYNLYNGHGFSGTDYGEAFGKKSVQQKIIYEPAITRGPVYPFFIFAVYRMFGTEKEMASAAGLRRSWDRVRIAQSFLDTAVCAMVFFMTYIICGRSYLPALISSALYCFSFYNIYYTRTLLSECVTTFLLTAFLLFLILAMKYRRLLFWALSGAVFGSVALSRPEYLLFTPFLILYEIIAGRGNIPAAARNMLIFIIAAIIVMAPWSARNYLVFKKPIPVSIGAIGYNTLQGAFEGTEKWKNWKEMPDSAFD